MAFTTNNNVVTPPEIQNIITQSAIDADFPISCINYIATTIPVNNIISAPSLIVVKIK